MLSVVEIISQLYFVFLLQLIGSVGRTIHRSIRPKVWFYHPLNILYKIKLLMHKLCTTLNFYRRTVYVWCTVEKQVIQCYKTPGQLLPALSSPTCNRPRTLFPKYPKYFYTKKVKNKVNLNIYVPLHDIGLRRSWQKPGF